MCYWVIVEDIKVFGESFDVIIGSIEEVVDIYVYDFDFFEVVFGFVVEV